MSKIYMKFAVLLALLLTACQTYVSTKALDREYFTFKHAGKVVTLPVELQEIRTSTRRGGLFSGRKVTYTYAMVVISDDQELVQYPCQENASIEEFMAKLKIKRSKDRSHFAIGIGHQTIAVFHSFNKHRFTGYAPLVNKDESMDFATLDLNALPPVRSVLLDHVSGDNVLKTLDENTLVSILCSVSPQDELNQEAMYMLTDNRVEGLSRENEERLINHCKKSENWRKKALYLLRENKDNQEVEDYIAKVYRLAGKAEVDKEDWKALRNADLDYFKMRLKMNEPKMNADIDKQFRAKIEQSVFNVCNMSKNQRNEILSSIQLLQELGEKRVIERFIESYEKSRCKSESIHDINNAFTFMSNIKSYERRAWVDFMVRNFQSVPASDRDWDYDRIEDDLTCSQKRQLLLKYKKDIDTFGDMTIPECN